MNMPLNQAIWTADRIAELILLYERGLSYRQIANEMTANPIGAYHHYTRNAICGKSNRLNLSPRFARPLTIEELEARRSTKRDKDNLRQKSMRQMNPAVRPPKPIIALAPFTGSLNIPFADLDPFKKYAKNQCRFIAGEPPGPEYFACGNPTPSGDPYCVHCHGITHCQPGIVLSDAERARARQSSFSPSIVPQTEAAE